MSPSPRTEVLVFGFDDPSAQYEGRLIGALERAESGGAIHVLEVLFAARDAEAGAPTAVRLGGGSGGLVAAMAEFRLDADRREDMTRRALEDPTLRELAEALQPGSAVAAVLVEHTWAAVLEDAAARSGGRPLASAAGAEPDLARAALASTRGPHT